MNSKPDPAWFGSLVWVARIACIGAVAGFFIFLAMISADVKNSGPEAQLYILYRYFTFAVVAVASAVCLLVTIVVRFRGLHSRLALVLDGLLVLASLVFSFGVWIARW